MTPEHVVYRGCPPLMNLLRDGAAETARKVKLRIIARAGIWGVHVRPDGGVLMDKSGDVRRSADTPESWFVGTYSRSAPVADIEADLAERALELVQEVAA